MLLYFVVQIVGSLITLAMLFLYALFPLNNPLWAKRDALGLYSKLSGLVHFSHLLQWIVSFITEGHQKLSFILHVFFSSAVLSWNTSQLTDKGSLFG